MRKRQKQIQKQREQLSKQYAEKGLNDETLAMSQELDKLIVEEQKLLNNLHKRDIPEK